MSTLDLDLPDDAEQRDLLHKLVAYRQQIIAEIAARLDAFDRAEAAAIVRAMADA